MTVIKVKEFLSLFRTPRYKKITLYCFSFGLLFTAVIAYELYSSKKMENHHAQIQVSNLSHVLEEHLSSSFRKIDLTLLEIAKIVQYQETNYKLDEKEIKNLLLVRLNQFPEASTFFVTDKNGFDLFREINGKKLFLGEKEDFLSQKKATQDELLITKPRLGVYGSYMGVPVIAFSRRLVNKNNEFNGIVAALVPLSNFQKLFSALDIGQEGAINLLSDENILYARVPWDERFIGKELPNRSFINKIAKGQEKSSFESIASPIDGLIRLTSTERIGQSKFFISVGFSENEVLAVWKTRSQFYLGVIIALWIGGAFTLFKFLHSLQELEIRRKLDAHTSKLSSLGEMAAGIAHEINNPLAIISSHCIVLKKQVDRDQITPALLKESLNKMEQTVHRIAKIVRGLKSLSRNTQNDLLAPVELKVIIENASELCREKFRQKMVNLKIDPIPEMSLHCREAEIVQVLLNLLTNAFDAVEALEEKWIHLTFKTSDHSLTMYFIDSGKGIPDDVYQNLMHPFFTTKEVGKGTGLGLPISKGIIENHGGKIYLDRKAGNTTFVIELPACFSTQSHQTLAKIS